MSTLPRVSRVDIRDVDIGERRATAVMAYRRLDVGDAMEVLDGADPIDLYSALHAIAPGDFSWLYRERGPGVWCVNVRKLSRIYSAGECCGMCGGGHPKANNPTRSNP
jgi:uncharacterized protein (DUF2249 family)